jgi:two-component system, chemotaxis family, chemotaxis protein CheY
MKILVVDDSNLSRRTMRGILESQGYQIIEAQDGMTAIERYFLEKPDLVMLDIVMTGMQGLEVLEKLRKLDNQARVIIATADLQTFTHQLAMEAGAVGVVNKPFTTTAVVTVVNNVLQGVQQ